MSAPNLRPDELARQRQDRAMLTWLARNIDAIRQDEAAADIAHGIQRLRQRVERVIDNRDPDTYFGPCQADVVEAVEVDGFMRIWKVPGEVCGADLIGAFDAAEVTCPECGVIWPTADVREWLVAQSRDVWATPRDIVRALQARGEKITIEKLRNWISRDKAAAEAGRARRVLYPPILQVGAEPAVDYRGQPVMQPMLDTDGRQVTDDAGRPVEVQATRPLYRLGDVLDRLETLAEVERQRKDASA